MEKSLKYYHKGYLLLIALILTSCHQEVDLYKRVFSETEQKQLSKQILAGIGDYYQGTPQEKFLIEEGISYDPKLPEFWRELGAPNIKRGFAHASHHYYGKAVELDPLQWQGWRGYLYLYFYRDYKRALADFDATDILTPNFVDAPQSTSVDFMRGICYLQLGNYEEAHRYLELHIAEEANTVGEEYIDTRTFMYQGIAYFKQGELTSAIAAFQRGLKNVEGKSADLWYWLATVALEKGEKDVALEAIEAAEQEYEKGYFHERPYVEEFYEIHPSMIEALKGRLLGELKQ